MELEVGEVAQQVTNFLGPYLKPLLEKSEIVLEKSVAKKVVGLWDKLSAMILNRPAAKAAAEKLAANPTDRQVRNQFTRELTEILAFMPNLLVELKPILAQTGVTSHNAVTANAI